MFSSNVHLGLVLKQPLQRPQSCVMYRLDKSACQVSSSMVDGPLSPPISNKTTKLSSASSILHHTSGQLTAFICQSPQHSSSLHSDVVALCYRRNIGSFIHTMIIYDDAQKTTMNRCPCRFSWSTYGPTQKSLNWIMYLGPKCVLDAVHWVGRHQS